MNFSPKRGLFISIYMAIMLLFFWWKVIDFTHGEIALLTEGKYSLISIVAIIVGVGMGVFLTWLAVSCSYTITDEYLIAWLGPIRHKIKLSEIAIVRWSGYFEIDGGGLNTSWNSLYIRSTKNEILKVSPKDIIGFLKMLRERCPNAEITTNESPPSFFSSTIKSAKEQSLDKKFDEEFGSIFKRYLAYATAVSLIVIIIIIIYVRT